MDSHDIDDPKVQALLKRLVEEGSLQAGGQRLEVAGRPAENFYIVKGLVLPEHQRLLDDLRAALTQLMAEIEKHKVHEDVVVAFKAFVKANASLAEYGAKVRDGQLELATMLPALVKRVDAQKKARRRHDSDPKRAAKQGALALWLERHAGKHPKLRTTEQFAIEVMRRWPILESAKVICKWSATWNRAVKEGRTPSC